MITLNKKTKRKNIFTALGIVAFMIFLFFFMNLHVYNIRKVWARLNLSHFH